MTMIQSRPVGANAIPAKPSLDTPIGTPDGLSSLLKAAQGKIEKVLPKHMTPDRLMQIAAVAVSRTPKLLLCTKLSVLSSVMRAAELGLDCSGALGSAYLVPFKKGKKLPGGRWEDTYECQLIIGYRGMIDLARRSGQIVSIEARVVFMHDEFQLEYGMDPKLIHHPALDEDPGTFRLVYAVARLVGGGVQTEVMTKAAVDAIRRRSKSGEDGPWVTDYEEMARKTVIKRLAKYLPLTVEIQQAVADDEEAEFTESVPVRSGPVDLNAAIAADAPVDPADAPDDGQSEDSTEDVGAGFDRTESTGPVNGRLSVSLPPTDPALEESKPQADGPMTAADLADWKKAETILRDRAKDNGVQTKSAFIAAMKNFGFDVTNPAKSTPEQRLEFFGAITSGQFDATGNLMESAV